MLLKTIAGNDVRRGLSVSPLCNFCVLLAGESGSFLEFKRGDLIELGEDSADMIQSSGWCYGLCVRTEKRGDFPAECVYILPTMTRPPPDILV